MFFENIKPEQIYYYLIEPKIKLPAGLQHLLEDMGLTESEIKTGFSFAQKCSKSTFDQMFQYKIMTQILPTNKYLHQYRVVEANLCCKCNIMPDTVLHRLWQCQALVPFRDKIFVFLNQSNSGNYICDKISVWFFTKFRIKSRFIGAKKINIL